MTESAKPYCCHIECEADADCEIVSGPRYEDMVHSCFKHIGDLLTDAPRQEIVLL